ncbi:uncharacterized protein B0H18DRAFT_1047467 [Fomitopsis serialis]|uniref:uncharacterized protein n=1 Tax=Fomitopsis serialis TaxID=139415 RepID=UPI002008554C|nr:uncharacterized protein B0H18DRAFT_1047467 [Neoantrodia serialis]KAH9913876.1 hypothetical protein B0H18DRAFT_1047467 [Neoantrodia serialis]
MWSPAVSACWALAQRVRRRRALSAMLSSAGPRARALACSLPVRSHCVRSSARASSQHARGLRVCRATCPSTCSFAGLPVLHSSAASACCGAARSRSSCVPSCCSSHKSFRTVVRPSACPLARSSPALVPARPPICVVCALTVRRPCVRGGHSPCALAVGVLCAPPAPRLC